MLFNGSDLSGWFGENRHKLDRAKSDEQRETLAAEQREVFASHFHPAPAEAPFPGPTEMERWGNVACYDSFDEFVGAPYELSALEIGSIRPVDETWSDPVGLHREVLCYVYAPDAQLSGPMRNSEF